MISYENFPLQYKKKMGTYGIFTADKQDAFSMMIINDMETLKRDTRVNQLVTPYFFIDGEIFFKIRIFRRMSCKMLKNRYYLMRCRGDIWPFYENDFMPHPFKMENRRYRKVIEYIRKREYKRFGVILTTEGMFRCDTVENIKLILTPNELNYSFPMSHRPYLYLPYNKTIIEKILLIIFIIKLNLITDLIEPILKYKSISEATCLKIMTEDKIDGGYKCLLKYDEYMGVVFPHDFYDIYPNISKYDF